MAANDLFPSVNSALANPALTERSWGGGVETRLLAPIPLDGHSYPADSGPAVPVWGHSGSSAIEEAGTREGQGPPVAGAGSDSTGQVLAGREVTKASNVRQ